MTFDLAMVQFLYPWRIGWRELDPRRPCYTCGAAPTSAFPDGSPRYPASCIHPAIRDGNPTLDWRPAQITYTLTPAEIERARKRATKVVEDDIARGWDMYFRSPTGESRLEINLRGFGAELAASRATGLKLNWGYLTKHYQRSEKPPDIGQRTEVRNWRNPSTAQLTAKKDEKDGFVYLLVTGRMPTFTVRGWMEGMDLMIPSRWKEPPEVFYASYCASPLELQPLPLPPDA